MDLTNTVVTPFVAVTLVFSGLLLCLLNMRVPSPPVNTLEGKAFLVGLALMVSGLVCGVMTT